MHYHSGMIRRRTWGILLIVALGTALLARLAAAQADPQSGGVPAVQPATSESFAGSFFVSKATHADGTQTIDPVGSALLWTLLTLSVLNLGLIGYLALANSRKSLLPAGVSAEDKRLLNSGDYKQAIELTRS